MQLIPANTKYAVLMGDVAGSMHQDHHILYHALKELVGEINTQHSNLLLSPLTITLGDEFQAVAADYQAAVKLVFFIDERSRREQTLIKFKFSIVYGLITTPINKIRAHEMIGEGLQVARQLVSSKKRGVLRYQFRTGFRDLDIRLKNLFSVVDSITEKWKPKDFLIINAMIDSQKDSDVGNRFQKTRQQVYKRRKTLMIEDYRALKELSLLVGYEHMKRVS